MLAEEGLKLRLIVLQLLLGYVFCKDPVHFTAYVAEMLFLECKTDSFLFDVEFYKPDGSLYGSCPAMVSEQIEVKSDFACQNNITQYRNKRTTVLQLEKSEKWLGNWTCRHGTLPKKTININKSMLENQGDSFDCIQSWWIAVALLVILPLFVMGQILILKIITWIENKWQDSYTRVPADGKNKRELKRIADDKQEKCGICNRFTTFAYCDCKNFFCEVCSSRHDKQYTDHHMVQLRHHFSKSEEGLRCKSCSLNTHRVCTKCSEVFCDDCLCDHGNQYMRPIIPFERSTSKLKKQ